MIIGKSAARSSRRNVGDRPKTMCRQKLRTEGPAAGHPLYLAFLIGRTKSTLNSAILRFSAHDHFLSLCTDAGRVRPSTRTLLAFSRRGPCVPSRSARGRRMLFIRFINRAVQAVWRSHHEGRKQARDSGHSPFRGPARGRSPRARISILAPFNGLAAAPTVDRSSSIGAIDHRAGFSFSLCVTLAPKPTLKVTPVDPHAMQDAGELARDRDDRAQHARSLGNPKAPGAQCGPLPDAQQKTRGRLAKRFPDADIALFGNPSLIVDRGSRLMSPGRQAKMGTDGPRPGKAQRIIDPDLERKCRNGPTPGTVINRRQI